MEDSELTYPDWIYVARPKRDALRRLRPALLPRDKFREPTDYAKRWGMHPDRADGRSQLSPTSAPSRRISVALQVQLNHEHADTKALLTQETEFEGLNPVLEVDDQAKIAIKVYEDWKAKSGGTSIEQMKDTAALHVDPSTIDMEKLDTRDQEFYKCLQDEVQKDETWQRLLFKGLTTDELISNDIYNMTNNSRNKLDMGRELH